MLCCSSDLDSRGWVGKVADFGQGRLLGQSMESVESSRIGSITHMPPEVLCKGQVSKVRRWGEGGYQRVLRANQQGGDLGYRGFGGCWEKVSKVGVGV